MNTSKALMQKSTANPRNSPPKMVRPLLKNTNWKTVERCFYCDCPLRSSQKRCKITKKTQTIQRMRKICSKFRPLSSFCHLKCNRTRYFNYPYLSFQRQHHQSILPSLGMEPAPLHQTMSRNEKNPRYNISQAPS